MTSTPLSLIGLCDALLNSVKSNSNLNDRNKFILNDTVAKVLPNNKNKKYTLNQLPMRSIANKTPIAQFIVDIYTQMCIKYNLTIDQFMQQSKFMVMLSQYNPTCTNLITRHLSEYLRYIHQPIHQNISNTHKIHHLSTILHYVQVIHENMYKLSKICQIDLIFLSQSLHWINDEYFKKWNIKYDTLANHTTIKQMMRNFNKILDDKHNTLKRCVILIMETDNNICNDKIYIFEPLENNSLPPTIYHYTEMPWICNTKTNVFPDFALNDSKNALCLSFHRHHTNNNDAHIERVYFSYCSFGCRIFKHNLQDVLIPFCKYTKLYSGIDWNREINENEFKDHQYNIFVNTYFSDLNLLKTPNINDYLIENQDCIENRWSKLLNHYCKHDRLLYLSTVQKYMYVPTPMEYYQSMNNMINEYYYNKFNHTNMNNKFINYIYDNELEDAPLDEQLSENMTVDDCVLIDFDVKFPIVCTNKNVDRDQIIFDYLQKCYMSIYYKYYYYAIKKRVSDTNDTVFLNENNVFDQENKINNEPKETEIISEVMHNNAKHYYSTPQYTSFAPGRAIMGIAMITKQ